MSTQLLGVGFADAESCQAALAQLQVGILRPLWAVPRSMVGLVPRSVSGCMPDLELDLFAAYLAQHGWAVQFDRGGDRSFGNIFDRVIHLRKQISTDAILPSLIDLKEREATSLSTSLSSWISTAAVVPDVPQWSYQSVLRDSEKRSSMALASLWGTMVLLAVPPAVLLLGWHHLHFAFIQEVSHFSSLLYRRESNLAISSSPVTNNNVQFIVGRTATV